MLARMKAWRAHSFGPPESLRFDELPDPPLADGQVRVDVESRAAAIPVGARVALLSEGVGCYATQIVARETSTFRIPDAMSFEDAAAMTVTYQTGWFALHRRAQIKAGEWLLVHAAAGGVGSAAVQLGKAAGARTIATAGGAAKVQRCRELGADVVCDYTSEDFVAVVKTATRGRGADVVYDPVGGDVFDRSTKCIAFEGRIVVIGFTSGVFPSVKANHVLIKNYGVLGLHWGNYRFHDPPSIPACQRELYRLYEDGKIKPLVSERIPLAEAPAALARVTSRGSAGKIVLVP